MELAACPSPTVPTASRDTKLLNIRSDWPRQLPRPGDTIDLAYLAPLVQQQIANVPSEALVQTISNNRYTVSSLANQIESWVTHGFPLGHDGSLSGKHYTPNYKSSLEFRSGVTKSLLKRLDTNKTAGPFAWTGDLADLPFQDCAVNPIGAVRYKYEPDRARACDDPHINQATLPPGFSITAMQQIRDGAFPCCSWYKSDVASAFPCMPLPQTDLPWMMFTWYHPDDTDFQGTDKDCIYVHTHGNFGPRPYPHHFTMLMLYVNLAARTLGLDLPPAFIDDNIHCGIHDDLLIQAPRYHAHLAKAGLTDKPEKRELLRCMGDTTGAWFDSTRFTLITPQDN